MDEVVEDFTDDAGIRTVRYVYTDGYKNPNVSNAYGRMEIRYHNLQSEMTKYNEAKEREIALDEQRTVILTVLKNRAHQLIDLRPKSVTTLNPLWGAFS